MFHAFADDGDNRKASAKDDAENRVEDEADEDKSDDEVSDPTGDGVIVPEEVPGFFGVVFECVTHFLERFLCRLKRFLYLKMFS